ncbi:hypothetical protein PTKIN_Ptkin13bG0201800 [Pterospermum kingtungense]
MEAMLEGLSLMREEDEELVLELGTDHPYFEFLDLCLVGQFLTDRSVNFNVMRTRMAEVWRPGRGVVVKDIGSQRFLFQFFHIVDLKRVLNRGSWTFDNYILILHHLQPGEIGDFIGEFSDYDINNNATVCCAFMRIQVLVDVREPLKRFKKIRKRGADWTMVNFKYERLGSFCFLCGHLCHTDKFCELLFSTPEDQLKKEWGPWLKAPSRRGGGGSSEGERWLMEADSGVRFDGFPLISYLGVDRVGSFSNAGNRGKTVIVSPDSQGLMDS